MSHYPPFLTTDEGPAGQIMPCSSSLIHSVAEQPWSSDGLGPMRGAEEIKWVEHRCLPTGTRVLWGRRMCKQTPPPGDRSFQKGTPVAPGAPWWGARGAGGSGGAESKSPSQWSLTVRNAMIIVILAEPLLCSHKHCLIYPRNPSTEQLWLLFHKRGNWGIEK